MVKRRSLNPSAFSGSTRKLTVETRSKLIGDHISKISSPAGASPMMSTCDRKRHPAQELQTPGMVLSVWGSATTDEDKFIPYFAQKGMHFDGDLDQMRHRVGLLSHRGHKPESPNQDDFFVLSRPESLLVGVFDGHGAEGHDVAHFSQEHLPSLITERLRKDPEAWSNVLEDSVDTLVTMMQEQLGEKAWMAGATMTVVMVDDAPLPTGRGPLPPPEDRPLRVRCAFLGDSMAVWGKRKSKGAPWNVQTMTDIHRADRPDEAQRIEAAGGTVQPPGTDGETCSRLLTPEWNLAVSRSLGDFYAARYGLSHKPEMTEPLELEPGWEHLVLICSDGIWDVIPPAQAVAFVGKFRPEEAQSAAERLVGKAQLRWQECQDMVDDITAIVVWPCFEAVGRASADTPVGKRKSEAAQETRFSATAPLFTPPPDDDD